MNELSGSSSPLLSAKLLTGHQQSSSAYPNHVMQMTGTNGNSGHKPCLSDPNSPFYLITPPVEAAHITGATHLLTSYDLLSAYNKFSSKKVKQNLSSFISHLPGPVDTPATEDNSGLLSLVQRHPPVFKEIKPLTGAQLTGFRLYPGPIPDQYRIPLLQETQASKVKKHKKKKSKKRHQSGEPGLSMGGGPSVVLTSNISSSSVDLKSTASSVTSLSSIATSRHSTTQSSISALTSTDNTMTSETFASSINENSSLSSDKKNRKRVYEERDEKKKKKDKKKKRKKEIPSD